MSRRIEILGGPGGRMVDRLLVGRKEQKVLAWKLERGRVNKMTAEPAGTTCASLWQTAACAKPIADLICCAFDVGLDCSYSRENVLSLGSV